MRLAPTQLVREGTAASENNFHMTGGGGQDLDHETCADTLS